MKVLIPEPSPRSTEAMKECRFLFAFGALKKSDPVRSTPLVFEVSPGLINRFVRRDKNQKVLIGVPVLQ